MRVSFPPAPVANPRVRGFPNPQAHKAPIRVLVGVLPASFLILMLAAVPPLAGVDELPPCPDDGVTAACDLVAESPPEEAPSPAATPASSQTVAPPLVLFAGAGLVLAGLGVAAVLLLRR